MCAIAMDVGEDKHDMSVEKIYPGFYHVFSFLDIQLSEPRFFVQMVFVVLLE